MSERPELPEEDPKSTKLISWMLSGVGILLLVIGAIGFFNQEPLAPSEETPSTTPPYHLTQTATPKPPNRFFLLTVGGLGGAGWKEIERNPSIAPNFSAFARTATRFPSAYSPSTEEIQSVMSILSGTLPSKHRLFVAPHWTLPGGKSVNAPSVMKMPQNVHSIQTLMPEYFSSRQVAPWGLIRFQNIQEGWKVAGFPKYKAWRADSSMSDTMPSIIQQTINALSDGSPTQLHWTHFHEIEYPFYVEPNDLKIFLPSGVTAPKEAQLHSQKYMSELYAKPNPALLMAMYKATVRQWDRHLGTLLSELKKRDLLKTSTIIIVGTNSIPLDEKNSNWSFHQSLTRAQLHVPLVVLERGQTEGKVINEMVSTGSIAPTILELAGYARAPQFQFNSLVPLLKSQPQSSGASIMSELIYPYLYHSSLMTVANKINCFTNLDASLKNTEQRYCLLVNPTADATETKTIGWQDLTPAQRPEFLRLQQSLFKESAQDPYTGVRGN